MKQKNVYLVLFGLLTMHTAFAGSFFSKDADPQLNSTYDAYASGDYLSMVKGIHEVLLKNPNDALIKENVTKLWRQASIQNNSLPADWHLPEGVKQLKISVRHGQSDQETYALKVGGRLKALNLLKQLKVIRYADHSVILDKEAGIGDYSEETSEGEFHYNFDSPRTHDAFQTGLYLLNIELTDGEVLNNAWFVITDDDNSTAFPELLVPSVGQKFETPNPTFRFANFKSPQYKSYETRSTWSAVSRASDWKEVWQYWELAPSIEEYTIGSVIPHVEEGSVSKLESGKYYFTLSYNETSRFGDVSIGRMCVTTRAFEVK